MDDIINDYTNVTCMIEMNKYFKKLILNHLHYHYCRELNYWISLYL